MEVNVSNAEFDTNAQADFDPVLVSGEYSTFQFFVVYMAVFNGSEGVGSLLSFGPNAAMVTAAANRILSLRVRDKDSARGTLELQDTSGGVEIEFKDVWFKYPTRDVPIFTGLNLTVCVLYLRITYLAYSVIDRKRTVCGAGRSFRLWQDKHRLSSRKASSPLTPGLR